MEDLLIHLRSNFDYVDGNLVSKNHTRQFKIGKILGYKMKPHKDRDEIYMVARPLGKHQLIHRLIFLHQHGHLPKIVDHINGNSLDNRIENLRAATVSENMLNQKIRSDNKSGCKNVAWSSLHQQWRVRMLVNGKNRSLGTFDDLEFADLVAQEARSKFHGAFARHI